jgi:PilZ domain-containing protein
MIVGTAERRGYQRKNMSFSVVVQSHGIASMGLVRNASSSGMLIAMPRQLDVGSEATILVRGGEDGCKLELDAVVVRSQDAAATPWFTPPQVAVRFSAPSPMLEEVFERAESSPPPSAP